MARGGHATGRRRRCLRGIVGELLAIVRRPRKAGFGALRRGRGTEGATQVFLEQPGLKVSTRLVTGNYPAYEKVLPAELPKRVIIDREVFLRTLRFVGLKKDDYNKNVRLFFEFPNLRTVFQHPDEGVNQATLPFTGEEHPFELAFNIDYLTELLERLPGEEAVYQFKDEVGQGVFMSPSLEDLSFRYVLMLVRFANSATV